MKNNGVVRRRDKRIWLVVFLVFVSVFSFSFLMQKFNGSEDVEAASLAGFDPGYIISDYQMGNYNSMNEAQIQAFLTSKNGCGNRDYNYYVALSRNTNYRWHFENGHFICLSEERFGHNDNEIGFQYGETAAHIIWQASQDYRINPQVLLVLLQKETGLITDPIPNNGDYRKATGYGCPDTAACSSKYYGFRNQIRNAAALFRTVLDGGWTNYPLGNNYIQYNPNRACGGSIVNVRSLATSALYRYTPYQPNAGALAAGYGTASCGAYGNRNFYLYFEDWFGGITEAGPNYDIDADDISDELKKILSAKYESMKAELGRPTSKTNCNIGHAGACVKAFEKGVLLYSPTRGILESYGEIRRRHVAVGSIDGVMGFPVSGVNCNIGHAGACVQAFEKGVIIYSPTTGAWESYGEVRNRHIQLATIDGVMGFPVSGVNCNIGHAGACVQAFENGVIIHNPTTGTWESYGEIKARYTNNGSVDGRFGFPIEGVINGKISYQKFEKGAIVKDKSGKYWVMSNEILARYIETSEALGNITTNLNCNIGYRGACVQAFENGVIIYSPTTGAWESYGAPRAKHIKEGSIDGKYGFPIGGVTVINGVQKQKFQGGEL